MVGGCVLLWGGWGLPGWGNGGYGNGGGLCKCRVCFLGGKSAEGFFL